MQLTTVRGPVAFDNAPDRFHLRATLPGNTKGVVYLPRQRANRQVWQRGKRVKAVGEGPFWKVTDVAPGTHEWEEK